MMQVGRDLSSVAKSNSNSANFEASPPLRLPCSALL